MKTLVLVALAALPVIGCAGAIDGEGSQSDGTIASSESELSFTVNYLVDFDHDPSGNPIADGTIVDNVYAAWGVTFSGILCTPGAGCASGHAYARADITGNNIVTPVPPGLTPPAHFEAEFDARSGAVRADFTTSKPWASVDAVPIVPGEPLVSPSDAQRPWFEAYDASNVFIPPTIYYPFTFSGSTGPGFGSRQTLKVNTAPANIKWVRFSVVPSAGSAWPVWGMFDNLRFYGYSTKPACPLQRGC
jgi:hypothetical protein